MDFKPTNQQARTRLEDKDCGAIGEALTQFPCILDVTQKPSPQLVLANFTSEIF